MAQWKPVAKNGRKETHEWKLLAGKNAKHILVTKKQPKRILLYHQLMKSTELSTFTPAKK